MLFTLTCKKVMKMKNKLGTRQLPTAELLLDGCEVELAITFSGMGRMIKNYKNFRDKQSTIYRSFNV